MRGPICREDEPLRGLEETLPGGRPQPPATGGRSKPPAEAEPANGTSPDAGCVCPDTRVPGCRVASELAAVRDHQQELGMQQTEATIRCERSYPNTEPFPQNTSGCGARLSCAGESDDPRHERRRTAGAGRTVGLSLTCQAASAGGCRWLRVSAAARGETADEIMGTTALRAASPLPEELRAPGPGPQPDSQHSSRRGDN